MELMSLRRRFANSVNRYGNVLEIENKIKTINNKDFKGDIYLNNYIKISKPYFLENGLCIQDTNYKWLKFYNYSSKVQLTAIYNEKKEIIEWYFDIARKIGKENGIPYEDDLYLDVVLGPKGNIILLDEDELKEAFEKNEVTQEEYDEAYRNAYELIERLKGNVGKVLKFTNKYLNEIL